MSTLPTPTDISTCDVNLELLFERGEHYGVVQTAAPRLAAEPSEAATALYLFRSLVSLGLIGPAMEMVSEGGGVLSELPEFQALRTELADLPSGLVAWADLQDRFEANAACVYERHEHLREHDAAFRGVRETLELYRSLDGNLHLSTREGSGIRQWLTGPCDVRQLVKSIQFAHDSKASFCGPYIVLGDHLGALFDNVCGGTDKMFLTFQPRVYLVEPDIQRFGALLYAAETTECLCSDRATVFVGAEWLEALVGHLREKTERMIPEYIVQSPNMDAAAQGRLLAALRDLTTERERAGRQIVDAVSGHYAGLDRAHWHSRYGGGGCSGLRILGLTSRFTTVLQYSMRDLKVAFDRLGCECRLLIEPNDHDLLPPVRTAELIETFRPDMVFAIDHLRTEYQEVVPENMPFVCWIQDRMPSLFRPEAGRGVGPFEFVIGHGFPECLTTYGYPADRFWPCVIPTDPERMVDPEEVPEDLEPYVCDVMYATNATATPSELHAEYREHFEGRALTFVDAAHETLMSVVRDPSFCGDYDFEGLIRRVEREIGVAILDPSAKSEILGMQRFIAHQYLREEAIRAAARWADETGGRFHLYGQGWQARPEFARFAKGPVEHGRPLGRAFRGAKISLHAGCNPALHQRVLDGLCAGGFFLIQEKPSDLSHALNQAILRHIRKCNLSPPFQLRPSDLPSPFDAEYEHFLRCRGSDPDVGVTATQEMVLNVEAECAWGCLHKASGIWPRYREVVYRGSEGLAERIAFFLSHEAERQSLASEMRAAVMANFTYDALAKSLLEFMGRSFAGEGRSLGGSCQPSAGNGGDLRV